MSRRSKFSVWYLSFWAAEFVIGRLLEKTFCHGITGFGSIWFVHGFSSDLAKAFGGLRRGEKFTMDKAVVLRTEAMANCCHLT